MVLTTVVCYILCWMPYGVVAMMATFGRPGIITPVAAVVPSLLAKSSTVINPLIYILMNKQVSRGGSVCFLSVIGGWDVNNMALKDNVLDCIHCFRCTCRFNRKWHCRQQSTD